MTHADAKRIIFELGSTIFLSLACSWVRVCVWACVCVYVWLSVGERFCMCVCFTVCVYKSVPTSRISFQYFCVSITNYDGKAKCQARSHCPPRPRAETIHACYRIFMRAIGEPTRVESESESESSFVVIHHSSALPTANSEAYVAYYESTAGKVVWGVQVRRKRPT